MAKTETLSVRVSPRTRRMLSQAAKAHDSGASSLAREILERWAAEAEASAMRKSVEGVVSFLASTEGWPDEPADFFQGTGAE